MKKPATNTLPDFLTGYKPGDPIDKEKVEAEIRKHLRLYYLQMNSVQESFVRVKNRFGRMPKTRLLEAGNQLGKCLSFQSLIDTPSGRISIGELYEKGKEFRRLCLGWTAEGSCESRSSVQEGRVASVLSNHTFGWSLD